MSFLLRRVALVVLVLSSSAANGSSTLIRTGSSIVQVEEEVYNNNRELKTGNNQNQPHQESWCETFQATWMVREVRKNGEDKTPPPEPTFENGDTLMAFAMLCDERCQPDQNAADPTMKPPMGLCCGSDNFDGKYIGKMYLHEAIVGGARVPNGGYILEDEKQQILFQGVITEEDHEGPNGFSLGITGGTGRYRYATGYIAVEGAKAYRNLDGPKPITPTRATVVHVCGVVTEEE